MMSTKLQYACFKVGNETYAADIMKIREILRYQRITRIPKAPEFMEGVINLRGMAVPVIDMRKRLGLEKSDIGEKSRIVIAKVDGKDVGMIVDRVERVLTVEPSEVKETPGIVKGVEAEYLEGVIWEKDELVMVLDVNKVLSSSEKLNFEKIEQLNKAEVPSA